MLQVALSVTMSLYSSAQTEQFNAFPTVLWVTSTLQEFALYALQIAVLVCFLSPMGSQVAKPAWSEHTSSMGSAFQSALLVITRL